MKPQLILALVLFVVPLCYGAYRAQRNGRLKPILQGMGLALVFSTWIIGCTWLALTSK